MARGVMATLALVVFLRVLGVFLVLVGFVDHWQRLGGSVATSGVGFGAYALALALFLLPLAAWSDRIGRRNAIVVALLVSALGGIVAAFATTPWLFVVGRFVQGAGAVNGVALAVAGEMGEPAERTRRMAVLGAAAGGGVVVGLLSSAVLARAGVGIPAILLAFSAATLLTVPLVMRAVPTKGQGPRAKGQGPGVDARPWPLARGPWPLALGFAAFAVNFSMAGLLLYSRPLLERAAPGLNYEVALLVMLVPAGLGMFAAARLADRGRARLVGLVAATLLALSPLAFLGASGAVAVVLAGVAFFIGHSSITSLVPALVARAAGEGRAGAAQGFQSTLQYLGSFAGAAAMGYLFGNGLVWAMAACFVGAGALVAVAVARAAPGGTDDGPIPSR